MMISVRKKIKKQTKSAAAEIDFAAASICIKPRPDKRQIDGTATVGYS